MNIIFHHPLPLDVNARAASGIRPLRMIKAFRALGYRVDVVAGYGSERKKAIKVIKENIASGTAYSFVYAESSTLPTILTEPHRLPLYPFLDFNFFRFCHKNNIPIGVFYRDIYWRFENFNNRLGFLKSMLAGFAFRYELWVYKQTVTKLFLPSIEMGKYVPFLDSTTFEALPPGHMGQKKKPSYKPNSDSSLKLFYVGGMSTHYQMHELFDAVRSMPNIELTVCTREQEWQQVNHEYPELSNNIRVIHEVGEQMESYIESCDIALLFVKPQEYWTFASPVKLYEYLGFYKPIIATSGTLAAKFISDNQIGWAIDYSATALQKLLENIQAKPEELEVIYTNLDKVAPLHSWKNRAVQVAKSLLQ